MKTTRTKLTVCVIMTAMSTTQISLNSRVLMARDGGLGTNRMTAQNTVGLHPLPQVTLHLCNKVPR